MPAQMPRARHVALYENAEQIQRGQKVDGQFTSRSRTNRQHIGQDTQPDPHLQQGSVHEERCGPQEERCGGRSGWPRHASSTLKFMNCPLRRQLPLSSAVGAIRSNSLRSTFRHSVTFLAGARRKVRLITLLCAPSQRANYFLPERSLLFWCSRTGMRQSGLCASNKAS